MSPRRLTAIAAYVAIAAVLACSDSSPVAPKSPSAPSDSRIHRPDTLPPKPPSPPNVSFDKGGSKPKGTQRGPSVHHVRVLRWLGSGLKQDVSGSAIIGKAGGTITLADLGVTFRVPAGALTSSTRITVTALAGHRVVFSGTPSGTHFGTPAVMTVDLSHTNAYRNKTLAKGLVGGYIPSISWIGSDDTTDDTEDYPATSNDLVTTASFPVPHFSVVILASQVRCPSCNAVSPPPQ